MLSLTSVTILSVLSYSDLPCIYKRTVKLMKTIACCRLQVTSTETEMLGRGSCDYIKLVSKAHVINESPCIK